MLRINTEIYHTPEGAEVKSTLVRMEVKSKVLPKLEAGKILRPSLEELAQWEAPNHKSHFARYLLNESGLDIEKIMEVIENAPEIKRVMDRTPSTPSTHDQFTQGYQKAFRDFSLVLSRAGFLQDIVKKNIEQSITIER